MSNLRELVEALRESLSENGTSHELWGVVIPEGADPQELDPAIPAGVAGLLALSDGPYLDHTTQLYGADDLPDQQVNENLIGARLPDGTSLTDASHFFCFGQAAENPLLVDTRDQSVWRVPDDGFVWYTGCRLERVSDGVEQFFTEWVASSRFKDLAGLAPEDLETNDWYRLLRLTGLAT